MHLLTASLLYTIIIIISAIIGAGIGYYFGLPSSGYFFDIGSEIGSIDNVGTPIMSIIPYFVAVTFVESTTLIGMIIGVITSIIVIAV